MRESTAGGRQWEGVVCQHCGELHVDGHWRCEYGLCADLAEGAKAPPASFSDPIDLMPVAEYLSGHGLDEEALREAVLAMARVQFLTWGDGPPEPLVSAHWTDLCSAAILAYLDHLAKREEARCDFCGQTEGHSQRCAVTKWGLNPKPPYTPKESGA